MRFISLVTQLIDQYENDVQYTDNQVCLLGTSCADIPIAIHFLYAPMPEDVRTHLTESYLRKVPTELLEIYSFANGMDLFRTMRKISDSISLPVSKISIFGIPILADRNHLEPFNISIEDLQHPIGAPASWLKFGSYNKIEKGITVEESNLFVDTVSGATYQVERNSLRLRVANEWESIDDCLCELLLKELSL